MVQTKCGFGDTASRSGSDLLVLYGPTIYVSIGFDPSFNVDAGRLPKLGREQFQALVDTGSTQSCIDNLLAATLGLPAVDRAEISGVAGRHTVNLYLAQVYVPALQMTIHGAFAGVDLNAGGQVHHALLGRTFLRHFTMTYEGRIGSVTLSNE